MGDFNKHSWFVSEVVAHEGALRGYLQRFFSEPSDIADGVQETYIRLLSLSDEELERIRSAHAFLFTTARNVAVDWLRKRRVVTLHLAAEPESLNVLDERPSAYEELSARQELSMLAQAIASLPARCREVLLLRKLYGLSQKEIAARLGISENTVEKHVTNGLRRCAAHLAAACRTRTDPAIHRALPADRTISA